MTVMGPAEAMSLGLEVFFRAVVAFFKREKIILTIKEVK